VFLDGVFDRLTWIYLRRYFVRPTIKRTTPHTSPTGLFEARGALLRSPIPPAFLSRLHQDGDDCVFAPSSRATNPISALRLRNFRNVLNLAF
jgi:hypothetical protein